MRLRLAPLAPQATRKLVWQTLAPLFGLDRLGYRRCRQAPPPRPRAPDCDRHVHDAGRRHRSRRRLPGPCGAPRSFEEPKSDDVPQGGDAVSPRDFLALLVGASMVPNWHFIDAAAEAGDFDGELGLEAEAIAAKLNGIEHLATEDFVADFHISQVQVAQQVAEKREHLVAEVMPEVEHAVRAAVKAVPEHYIGETFQNRLEQLRIIARIVLEIGVLDEDDIAGGMLETCPE